MSDTTNKLERIIEKAEHGVHMGQSYRKRLSPLQLAQAIELNMETVEIEIYCNACDGPFDDGECTECPTVDFKGFRVE